MRFSEFYKIYRGFFVLEPAVEKIYSQVRLMLSPTVSVGVQAALAVLLFILLDGFTVIHLMVTPAYFILDFPFTGTFWKRSTGSTRTLYS
jgi:flagellar biosynthesis protein FliP